MKECVSSCILLFISTQLPLPSQPQSSLLLSVCCPIHQSLLQFQLSQSAASPPVCIYVNTVQYQIILLHGCVKWLGHPFGSSSLLTIFGCVSNPFSAQPWSCGSSAWRHCVSVDPYGAEHREGGTHSPLSTLYTHFAKLGLQWDLGSGGCWEKWQLTRKIQLHLYSHTTSHTKTGGSGFMFLVGMTSLSSSNCVTQMVGWVLQAEMD